MRVPNFILKSTFVTNKPFNFYFMKRIAVIAGGFSSEHIISLKSAQTIMNHINRELFDPYLVMIDRFGWRVDAAGGPYALSLKDFSFERNGSKVTFDGAYMMIHGTPGEDGKLQGYFDMIGLPYTGCNQLASTLTFNKWACNTMLKQLKFNCAESVLIRKGDSWSSEAIIAELKLPCFVKPNDGGSSFGVTKVKLPEELPTAIELAFAEGTEVLMESMITGTEITCGVLKISGVTTALPVTEIIPEGEFFDYAAKYEGKSSEVTPARLDPHVYKTVQSTAESIYDKLGLGGVVRIDMMIQEGIPYVIEINTVPGMSAASIIPQQAEKAGVTINKLISELINVSFR